MFSKLGGKKGKATSKAKPSFSSFAKAKASLAKASGSSSSKAKASGSSHQIVLVKISVPIRKCVIGLANGRTWHSILNKTFRVKIPRSGNGAAQKKEKRKIVG
ncbi:hypothetical protein Tco_0859985 [Tanacetum coccineum]|uniref:Uncharacterized protein n=1 Tax=Tanacetum coccineum TaxID=301880 RepID=A0ABQ5BGL1_9ASTR